VLECGLNSLWLQQVSELSRLESSSHSIAIVALACDSRADMACLELIHTLKGRGFAVIGCGPKPHLLDWQARCQILAAGVSCLLDSHKVDFAYQLKQKLSALILEKEQAWAERKTLKALMRDLRIVGESEAMLGVFRRIMRIGPLSDLPVLITGESGTGKELIAQAIHRLDPKRCGTPLVPVNCGAISPGLAESELFGHIKGAFTGADRDRKGLLLSAHQGVLFLDEIGELRSDLQAKLLRVIQERSVLSLGRDREASADFRVIAATNRDLGVMVEQKQFRADLFHRLNVLRVHIPPLRERKADLRPLIEHFAAKHQAVMAVGSVPVAQDFIDGIARLELPGNIRQLENLMLRAMIDKTDDEPLSIADLPEECWQALDLGCICTARSEPPLAADSTSGPSEPRAADFFCSLLKVMEMEGWNLRQSLAYCEGQLMEAALRHADGNQSKAARLLGVTVRTVYNKLKKQRPDDQAANPEAARP
jgi:transcriptional regulator with PAS, ATPase and Fis domain